MSNDEGSHFEENSGVAMGAQELRQGQQQEDLRI